MVQGCEQQTVFLSTPVIGRRQQNLTQPLLLFQTRQTLGLTGQIMTTLPFPIRPTT
jgi:hypothetical protein